MATTSAPAQTRRRVPWDAHRGGASVVVGWLVSRALIVLLLVAGERYIIGDVFYYQRKIAAMFDVGLAGTLNEYPTPVAWLLTIPYAVAFGNRTGYLIAFVTFMVALDALFALLLFRAAGRRRDAGVDFWLAFIFLVGPLTYVRFDLVPAVLAGAALLVAHRRPAITGVLTGVGAALKLWPALLYGAFLAARRGRRALSAGFWGVGLGLALISLLAGGWARLFAPLTWQSDRGLQIESLWATPLMVLRAVGTGQWSVAISRYQAYEVFGPGVDSLLLASSLATAIGLLLVAALFVRAFRAADPRPRAIGLLVIAVVALTIITNKTLSPQYLLWLGGPVAVLVLLDRRWACEPDRESGAIGGLARQLLLLAVLTHLVYPVLYPGLLGSRGHSWLVVATMVTLARNLALLVFTIVVCRVTWVALGPARRRRGPELDVPDL